MPGNGAKTEYLYNALGQLMRLTNQQSSLPLSPVLSEFSVPNSGGYDGAGNRLSLTASIPALPTYNGTTSYAYDLKDQLLSESSSRFGGFTGSYGYDPAGNPTTFKGASRSYNVKNQLTGGAGLGAFAYDGNGNPTVYNGTALTFDVEDRMTSFGTVLTAGYGADGLRAWKQSASGRTYFLYDGTLPIVELDGAGNVTAVNTFGANGLLSRRTVTSGGGGGGTSVFYTFDERGSTAQRLDGTASVLSSHVVDAFGVTASSTPVSGDPFQGFGAQFGYYGDEETGLYLCTFRYYDPQTGRWINRDPIGYAGGINLYAYVHNNPVTAVDPLGLDDTVTQTFNAALRQGKIKEALEILEMGFGAARAKAYGALVGTFLANPRVQQILQSSVKGLPRTVQAGSQRLPDCERYANRIYNALQRLGAGESSKLGIYRMKPRAGFAVPLKNNGGGFPTHDFVLWNNRVIDTLTGPQGQPFTEWVKRWDYVDRASEFPKSYILQQVK